MALQSKASSLEIYAHHRTTMSFASSQGALDNKNCPSLLEVLCPVDSSFLVAKDMIDKIIMYISQI